MKKGNLINAVPPPAFARQPVTVVGYCAAFWEHDYHGICIGQWDGQRLTVEFPDSATIFDSFQKIMEVAEAASQVGPVLICVGAALGVPKAYKDFLLNGSRSHQFNSLFNRDEAIAANNSLAFRLTDLFVGERTSRTLKSSVFTSEVKAATVAQVLVQQLRAIQFVVLPQDEANVPVDSVSKLVIEVGHQATFDAIQSINRTVTPLVNFPKGYCSRNRNSASLACCIAGVNFLEARTYSHESLAESKEEIMEEGWIYLPNTTGRMPELYTVDGLPVEFKQLYRFHSH